MARIIILILCIGILAFVGTKLFGMLNLNRCKECNGLGYWEGTRGDRNQCNTCHGTGKG